MGFASFGPCTSEPVVTSVSRATFPAPCDGLAQESTAIWQLLRVNDAAKETRISHSDPFFFLQKCQSSMCYLGWENVLRSLPGLIELRISSVEKKNQKEHISLQVQVISGPEFSLSGTKALHGCKKDPVIRSTSGDSRRIKCRNCT